jgi:hypothetical protein
VTMQWAVRLRLAQEGMGLIDLDAISAAIGCRCVSGQFKK